MEGSQLRASASIGEGDEHRTVEVKGVLGTPERNKLLFRELALKLLATLLPRDASVQVRLGVTLKEEGLVVQAIEAYKKAVEIDPTWASAHFNMGLAHDSLGDIPSAISAYKKAVEADPTHAGAKYSWALDDLRERGDRESREVFLRRVGRAVELFRQVLGVAPRNMEARFLLVEGLAILGNYSEALEECDRIKRIFPGEGRASEVKGNLLMRLKRFREALAEFRKLDELDPSLITNAYFFAAALEGLGRDEEAAAKYLEFIERTGDDPKFEKARGNAKSKIEALRPGEKAGRDK
ncbi:MAG: tetratricopeptide repeat protein [Planctomycetota bacterium]|jgi:tetratricopeptide (TPR) repeat protein